MKKYSMRVLACFMACVIAFNVIAIPNAKAATIIDATEVFGSNITAAFARVVGVKPLTSSFSATGSGFKSLATKYTASTKAFANASLFFSAIAAGAKINKMHLELTKQSYAYLVDFFNWVIGEYGLEPGAEPVIVPVISTEKALYNGVVLPALPDIDYSSYPYVYISKKNNSYSMGCINNRPKVATSNSSWLYEAGGMTYSDNWLNYSRTDGVWKQTAASTGKVWAIQSGELIWTNFDVLDNDGSVHFSASEPLPYYDTTDSDMSITLDFDYSGAPEVLEGHQIELNIADVPDSDGDGAVSETEFNEYIPAAIYAGDYAPTYEITVVDDAGANVNPDVGGDTGTDTDTQVGLLGRIAAGIDALADKILDGISSLFAPDPALMQDISGTFNSKFGFVSTLHQLGTDLLSIDAASVPP